MLDATTRTIVTSLPLTAPSSYIVDIIRNPAKIPPTVLGETFFTRDSNPAGVADQAGDVVLDVGGQDPVEDEHNVLADKATGQSSVGTER